MNNIKTAEPNTHGAPLAVCVNDCMLDYGQPAAQLRRVCFQVRCAFAEMRWGQHDFEDDPVSQGPTLGSDTSSGSSLQARES